MPRDAGQQGLPLVYPHETYVRAAVNVRLVVQADASGTPVGVVILEDPDGTYRGQFPLTEAHLRMWHADLSAVFDPPSSRETQSIRRPPSAPFQVGRPAPRRGEG